MLPLATIAHWPPSPRRRRATVSWTRPATMAQAPHTRRTAGMPAVTAKASPTAATALIPMVAYRPAAVRPAREERASTAAAADEQDGPDQSEPEPDEVER